jgi:glycosyltransferase involved in cell wall biosynthesis
MRIGMACVPSANAQYRAVDPMKAMAARGHDVVWPSETGHADLARLLGCDVVHVYRLTGSGTRHVLEQLADRGSAITYDNDDDYTTVPKESPNYKEAGGIVGQRIFKETVKAASLARTFITTNDVLAERYRSAGVDRVEVIGNHLATDLLRPRQAHRGVVIGWVAGGEHLADVARIPIREALERVVARHDDVLVRCIGVDLELPERYEHEKQVDFPDLPRRIGGFDIGIAPLADIPCNWARSDIKVKEYAASGVPWLASPIGPYAGLGENEGGRLVPNDGWFEALDRLVTHARERRRLAKKAKRWAKGQTIDAVAERWEQVFAAAAFG